MSSHDEAIAQLRKDKEFREWRGSLWTKEEERDAKSLDRRPAR